MRKLMLILLVMLHSSVYGQFRLLNDPYVETEVRGITIGILNERFSLGSNANIGQWNGVGMKRSNDVISFSELDKELLRVQFRSGNLKIGYHAHLYSYQSINLESDLFNMLYGDRTISNSYDYSYFGNSTFTHSISAQKQINKRTRLSGFLNFHNLNSYYNLAVSGENSFSEVSPQITLNSNYTSINAPHIDKNRSFYALPNSLNKHDSVHITRVLAVPSSLSISLSLSSKPTEFSRLHLYMNNLGPSSGQLTSTEFKRSRLAQEPYSLEREDLFNSSPIMLNPLSIQDSLFNHSTERTRIKGRPRNIGGSFEVDFSTLTSLGMGLDATRLYDFNQVNAIFYSNWKIFKSGVITGGIQTQNISSKVLSNLLLGLSFRPTEEIQIITQTSTGLNYAFYNSELIPRTYSRINHTITALITLP